MEQKVNHAPFFTFMGRKPNPRFQGEAVSDYQSRPIGCRVKFKLKSNSINMYDKCSVLRIETTINNPREFKVCATVDGKNVAGFNVWSPKVVLIMETVCNGQYLVSGFRNKDISNMIYPGIHDHKKLSSKTSRILKKFRQHGLIKKVQRSRRYHVTSKGRRVMGALIELRHSDYPKLAAKSA